MGAPTPHGRAGIEFLEVTYEVNANSGPLASHYGEEFIHVRQGALEVEFAFNRVVLLPATVSCSTRPCPTG